MSALFLMSACSKDAGVETGSVMVERTFTAVIEPSVKTSRDVSGKVSWSKGDVIRYIAYGSCTTGEYVVESDCNSVSLTVKTAPYDSSLVAFYGCDVTNAGSSDRLVPTEQTGLFKDAHICVAETSDLSYGVLHFRNRTSLVEFELKRDDVAEVRFHDLENSHIEGAASSSISVNINGPGKYYISMLPTSMAAFSMVFYDTDGQPLGRILSEKGMTLNNNTVLTLGVLDDRIEPAKDMELKAAVDDEIVPGSSTVMFSDGRFVMYTPDSLGNYVAVIDSIDIYAGELVYDDPLAVECDSLKRPILCQLGDEIFSFYDYTDESFSFTKLNVGSGEEQTFQNVSYASAFPQTKGGDSANDALLGGISMTVSVLSAIESYATYAPRGYGAISLCKSFVQMGMSYIPVVGNISLFGWEVLEKSYLTAIGTAGLAILGAQLVRGAAKSYTSYQIGDIYPYIDVSLTSLNSVNAHVSIYANVAAFRVTPYYQIRYRKLGGGIRYSESSSLGNISNFSADIPIQGLSSGIWEFSVQVFPGQLDGHPYMGAFYCCESERVKVMIAPLDIISAEQIWYNADTDPILFQVKATVGYPSDAEKTAFGSGSIDGGSFGICVTQNGKNSFYSSGENVGTSSSEEYLIPVNASKSDFKQEGDIMVYDGEDIVFRTYYNNSGYRCYGPSHVVELSYEENGDCPDANHIHAIDLGLSVKWACCNVGASNPEEYGDYYAWGETETKSEFNQVTYKYCHGDDTDGDGWYERDWYYDNIGSDISGTQYDVALVKWGGSWRMPTKAEFRELVANCTASWTSNYNGTGVSGRIFTSKKNGNTIFLPAAGSVLNSRLYDAVDSGGYWSGTLSDGNAWYLGISSDAAPTFRGDRIYGRSVRPVTE